ncbi:plasmid mobilization protein [Pseudoruminococcus massiliensis]|uniref:plasmid mobilization protein n=1 Tax=Pseudoruminococcus massiliensis TaxID=2086583 RepID=UPI00307B8D33
MNRNIVMKFRATEEEAAEIRRKAAAAGMNVSRFLRTSAVKSQVVLYNTADIYGLRSDIRRIGNNINQIAMVVNSNRAVYQNDVRELRKQLNEMSGSIAEHLKPLSYEVL